jgi:hypothetical protein
MQEDQEALRQGANTLLEVAMGTQRANPSTILGITDGRHVRDAREVEDSSESDDRQG